MANRAFMMSAAVATALLFAPAVAGAAAPAVTLHCGDVITSDVTLGQDLTGCLGYGLVIGAPDVTVNLNHHRIAGSNAAGRAAIRDDGFANLRVLGGVLTHFDIGVDVENADGLHVVATQFTDNPTFAVLLLRSNGGAVLNNHISHAGGTGIQLALSDHYMLAGNQLSQNGDGIVLFQSSNNVIANNASSDSGSGIALVHLSNHNKILSNTTNREQDTGILLDDHVDNNLIHGNHADGSGFAGIGVGASDGNIVSDNHADRNLGSGIAVGDNATNTLVARNHADRNGASPPGCVPDCPLLDDGIHVDAPGTTLAANHTNFNADLGIDAVPGVIDGRMNTAHHDGDARECTIVACG